MELQSAEYFLFLGLVVIAHALAPVRWRVPLLLGASMFFYACSSVWYLALFLVLSTFNYRAAVSLSGSPPGPGRSWIFGGILALDLFVLIVFKYLRELMNAWPAHPGLDGNMSMAIKLAAPMGISYFTFQMVACVTDAYRQDLRLQGGWGRFLLFSLFFPQITSGPIPRTGQLLPQLSAEVDPTAEARLAGLRLIVYGLFKKFVVANRLGEYVTQIFEGKSDTIGTHYSMVPTLLGCIYNTLNLYADFSSYVDIARGSALLLGIRLEPNFDEPFTSTSVSEFWRRWHMTLSFWLRDYLYMPLLIRIRELGMTGVVLTLIFTFAVCGVWHDAAWTYLFFGVAQGLAMSGELLTKRWRTKRLKQFSPRAVTVAGWLYTMGFFVLSEVFFRASSLANAWQVFAGLLHFRLKHLGAEMFSYRPYDFAFTFVAVGAWFAVAHVKRRESLMATPVFVCVCGLLILFLGRLGTARFIYAGF